MENLYEGLRGCREFVDELLGWLSTERSQNEFDEKYAAEELKFSPCFDDDYILGSLTQGIGVGTWAGKINVLQILMIRGAIKAETRNDVVYYKSAVSI